MSDFNVVIFFPEKNINTNDLNCNNFPFNIEKMCLEVYPEFS